MTAATTWELDREHEEFRASVRAFVDRHVRPVVTEAEQAGRPPAALLKEMGAAGLLGLAIGEEDGGGGGDSLAMMVLSEELARASGGIAVTALVSGYMSAPHIARFGTAEQRARYLPGIIAGEKVAAIAVTEPGTGSNVAGITTRATPHGGGYRLDGTKMFITNAGIADVFVIAARTAPDGHRGITTFIVEAGTPGLSLGAAAAQDGLARLGHPRGDPGRLPGGARGRARRAEPGLPPDHVGLPAGTAHPGRDGRGARRGMPGSWRPPTPATARCSARR